MGDSFLSPAVMRSSEPYLSIAQAGKNTPDPGSVSNWPIRKSP